MKNGCMGIIFHESIFRIVGNFFSCQYKLGAAVIAIGEYLMLINLKKAGKKFYWDEKIGVYLCIGKAYNQLSFSLV